MPSKFINKVALITGAAQRIGAATARCLHAKGINIVIHCRNREQEAKQLQAELLARRKNSAIIVNAELGDIKCLDGLIEQVVRPWGRLDIIINNAATFFPTPIGEVTENQWECLFGSNLKAPFFLSQAALPYLREHAGCIINLIDIYGERPLKEYALYCMTKAGLLMLTKSLALEFGPEVRVNGISPGAILWPQDMHADSKQKIISKTCLQRKGETGDIANAILFLIQDGSYITGQVISVDGGRSIVL